MLYLARQSTVKGRATRPSSGRTARRLYASPTTQDPASARETLQSVATKLNLKVPDEVNQITVAHLHQTANGSKLLKQYGSTLELAKAAFPEVEWRVWQFPPTFEHFWGQQHNRLDYLRWLEKKLGFSSREDWYKVSKATFYDNYGGHLFKIFNSSPVRIVMESFPDHEWKEWKFEQAPKGFWARRENQQRYWRWLCSELELPFPAGLYEINKATVRRLNGSALLTQFNDSVASAIMDSFPEHKWVAWHFKNGVPVGYWASLDNRRAFFDWAASQLHIALLDQWYTISASDIELLKGHGLLVYYKNSLSAALVDVYSQHKWLPWKFANAPHRWWRESPQTRKEFCDWIAAQSKLSSPDDWYSLTLQTFSDLGGRGMLEDYDQSLYRILTEAYPNYDWQAWRFVKFAKEKATDGSEEAEGSTALDDADLPPKHAIQAFLTSLLTKTQLKPKSPEVGGLEVWYSFNTHNESINTADRVALARLGGLPNALRAAYPDHPWNRNKFHQGSSKTRTVIQTELNSAVSAMLP